jgi:hypothetical protein
LLEIARECLSGGGSGRCRGGWGCRCTPPRGTVVATDAGEQGQSLHREGEHLLPTCCVRGGADEHTEQSARFPSKAAWQHGAKSSADRSNAQPPAPEVRLNACRCEKAWGAKGGMRRTCTSATQRANLHEVDEVPRRRVAQPRTPQPHPSSIAPRPNASRATRWCRWLRASTPPRRDATELSAGRRRRAVVCREETAGAGGRTRVQGAESTPAGAGWWGTLHQRRSRRARGACRCRTARGARDRTESGERRRSWWEGVGGELRQVQRSSPVHRRLCEHVRHPETRPCSKWRHQPVKQQRAGRGRGGVWVQNALSAGAVAGGGGAEVGGGVTALCYLAGRSHARWESRGSSCRVRASISCRRAACASVECDRAP